jgi:hypothetical protein
VDTLVLLDGTRELPFELTPASHDDFFSYGPELTTPIECLQEDDGEFEIPAAVLAAAPEGFGTAEFERAERKHSDAGDKRLLTIARVNETYHFALGERCDRPEALKACERFAEHLAQVYEDCGGIPVPPLAETCPAYLSESCQACAEAFACRIANTQCTPQGLVLDSGCGCPTR